MLLVSRVSVIEHQVEVVRGIGTALMTGQLNFVDDPDFETPLDANGDNVYEVEVVVSDGQGGTASQQPNRRPKRSAER